MSEYQYYEFTAIDRPLTAREQSELRSLSTRADITATSLVNTYQWGDFKGDPRTLMERYFDAHLYLANWGSRRLMLRLPTGCLDLGTATDYCVGDSAYAWATDDDHVVICLTREDEDDADEWDLDGHGLLSSIIPARADLAAGDPRLLYLGWLRCVQSLELDDEESEPPVPAGIGTLNASLTAVVEFLCIDPDLVAAAAANSAAATAHEPTVTQLREWVVGLPATVKDTILTRLITSTNAHVGSELLRQFRDEHPADTTIAIPRTVGELLATAQKLRARRERRLAEQREQDRVRRERSAAAARQRYLDELAVDVPDVWRRVAYLIDTKKPREYDDAVQILVDLRDLSERDGSTRLFQQQLVQLRMLHARKPSLLERLDVVGLDA